MIYILLVVLTTASFNVMFKLFERFGVNTLQAILFNYVTAVTISVLISPVSYPVSEIVTKGWFYTGMLLGIAYFVSMYLYSLSTVNIGVALTALLTRTSLVIPTVAALFFFNESFTARMGVAIAMIFVALYFIFYTKEKPQNGKGSMWIMVVLPALVFLTCGLNDVLMKSSQFFFIKNDGDNASFITIVYLTSLIFGAGSYFLSRKKRKDKFCPQSIFWGILMGTINIINSLCVLKALSVIPASVAFPVINTGIVVLSTFIGLFFFKERLTTRKIVGIVIALAAIVLLQ